MENKEDLTATNKTYDLLIADAQPIFRIGLKSILANKKYISQIHEAENAEKCISMTNSEWKIKIL